MTVGVLIQARMKSRRLGGKVLREVHGQPLLGYLLDRLQRCREVDGIVVATSLEAQDGAIEQFCRGHGVRCFRGAHQEVARRFADALNDYPCDVFVRVCADSPLLDPALVDQAVRLCCDRGQDVVTNVFPRSYPKGQSVEVLRAEAFLQAVERMDSAEHLEHVTRYFYDHPQHWRIFNFMAHQDYSDLSLAVDTTQDLAVFQEIVARFDRPQWSYSWQEVLHILDGIGASQGAVQPH